MLHDLAFQYFSYMEQYNFSGNDVDIRETDRGIFLAIIIYFIAKETSIGRLKLESYFLVLNEKCRIDTGEEFFTYESNGRFRIRNFTKFIEFAEEQRLISCNKGYFQLQESCKSILRLFARMPVEIKNLLDWILEKGRVIPSDTDLIRIMRYQEELDNYFIENKTNNKCGRLYERYIGYLFGEAHCKVEYIGAKIRGFGKGDGGIDLICHKGDTIVIVQCKNWKRNIPPKEIRDLIGAVTNYKKEHPDRDVKGAFFAASSFSKNALKEAKTGGIGIFPNRLLPESFPLIKCVHKGSKKSYYLPMDKGYDEVNLEFDDGDFYSLTVLNAEIQGFTRVYDDIQLPLFLFETEGEESETHFHKYGDIVKNIHKLIDKHEQEADQ